MAQSTNRANTEAKKVYVDDEGMMRYYQTGKEASFFGVNSALPFSHVYRALKELGVDVEEEIENDVYHWSRIGFDAFRIHVWDYSISDSTGNLIVNEHLNLLDYLIWKLKERDIQTILTPINFYTSHYPMPAPPSPGFSGYISKPEAFQNEGYWPVLQRFLRQFVNHTNPYTGLAYKNDPDIIGLELLNEPATWGDPDKITRFVNGLDGAIEAEGWDKPVFYNVSQNSNAAPAILEADIEGGSFQWYPAGLVSGRTLKGNYLPFVDHYPIPFKDHPHFRNKAQMIYEFSPADRMDAYAYPAMAREFRSAGFQWATQFSYDPLHLAYANTDYRTHYLNLAYTPAKAMGMMIASKVFHHIPPGKSYGSLPENKSFGPFRVSYDEQLAEMNSEKEFYHTGTTSTKPKAPHKLEHIAGTGSSPVVDYSGTGAYFLDKLEKGVWRLEIMPDAVQIKDPFGKISLQKTVTRIIWGEHPIHIELPGLKNNYNIRGLNQGNGFHGQAENKTFQVKPGAYLIYNDPGKANRWNAQKMADNRRLGEYVAPEPSKAKPAIDHQSFEQATAGKPLKVSAKVVGAEPDDQVQLIAWKYESYWRNAGSSSLTFAMEQKEPYVYTTTIPDSLVTEGLIKYRIVLTKDHQSRTFPGGHRGHPNE